MRIPLFNVDPTVVGPVELAKRRYRDLRDWAQQPIISVALIVVAGGLLGAIWIYDVSLPSIPNWAVVAAGAMIPGGLIALKYGAELADGLHEPEAIYLSELDTISGDQSIIRLSPERFRDVTVVNHNWDPNEEPMEEAIVGRERLQRVDINGIQCYEVDHYDPVLNVAECSWMVERSSINIRQDHAEINSIKTEMEDQIDKVYDILARETEIYRQGISQQVNEVVAKAQDSELPEEAEIGAHQSMRELFESEGLDEDLVEDRITEQDPDLDVESNGNGDSDQIDVETPEEIEL